jgi:hypothetical protein
MPSDDKQAGLSHRPAQLSEFEDCDGNGHRNASCAKTGQQVVHVSQCFGRADFRGKAYAMLCVLEPSGK